MTFPFTGQFSASLLLQSANDSHNVWIIRLVGNYLALDIFLLHPYIRLFPTIIFWPLNTPIFDLCFPEMYANLTFGDAFFFYILYGLELWHLLFFLNHLSNWLLEGRRKIKHLVYHAYHLKMVLFYFMDKAKTFIIKQCN